MNAPRIAVLGAGITGLTAALEISTRNPQAQLSVYDAADRAGGVLWTERHEDHVVELGADSFLTESADALELCRRLEIDSELISIKPQCRRALLVHQGRLVPVPEGWSLMAPTRWDAMWRSPVLSRAGKLRLLAERHVPRRFDVDDESFRDFAVRRLGREAYERLAQPLVSGIYTADPKRLSMAAALPRWWRMEREHGSLRAGMAAERSADRDDIPLAGGARYGLFVAPRLGMGRIVEALVARLSTDSLRLQSRVCGLVRRGARWEVELQDSAGRRNESFDAVVVALPAPRAAELLRGEFPNLAAELVAIEQASSAIVVVRFRDEQLPPLVAAGFVVPEIEGRNILAGSFSSAKFAFRAPPGEAVLRVFVGGAMQGDLVDLSDAELESLVERELRELLGAQGTPREMRIVRWRNAMPQYHVGHLERVARIEQATSALPALHLSGNAYHGVGISHCIRSGMLAAAFRRFETRVSSESTDSSDRHG